MSRQVQETVVAFRQHPTNRNGGGGVPVNREGPFAVTTSWPNYQWNGWVNGGMDDVAINELSRKTLYDDGMQNGIEIMNESTATHEYGSRPNSEQKERSIPNVNTSNGDQVYPSLLALLVVGFPASIMTILAIQLLLSLQFSVSVADSVPSTVTQSTAAPVTTRYETMRDVASAFCAVTISLSLCAMFSAFLQLFLCLKVLKLSGDSQVQIMRYLRQGFFLRFISFVGFFISIPIFLLAVILWMHVTGATAGSEVSTAVFTVIGTAGLLIITATLCHSIYSWFWGHLYVQVAEEGEEEREKKLNKETRDKNLSTLV